MSNKIKTETKTIEEIIEYWDKYHEANEVEIPEKDKVETAVWGIAQVLGRAQEDKLALFMASETDYDIGKCVKLADKLDRPSKLAEYLQIKFGDDLDKLMLFARLLQGISDEN
jgi:hypothetical protein